MIRTLCLVFSILVCGAAFSAEPAQVTPTFTEHIAPLIYAKCAGCHRDGQGAPFTLLTYAQVKKRAEQIADITDERVMPPWHADPGVVEYANDRSLSAAQIELIQRWFKTGAPEGDPAKLPAPPKFPEGWKLGTPDFVAETSEAYSIPVEGPDVYRNFVIPLNLTDDTWVNVLEFKPGRRAWSITASISSIPAARPAATMRPIPHPVTTAWAGRMETFATSVAGILARTRRR
jgi:hypothetical protein